MNLLIDSGNSYIKWSMSTDESFRIEGSCLTKETASLYRLWKNYDVPERVLVANVAGRSFSSDIKKVVKELWSLEAEFLVSSSNCCGLSNSYHKPEQLGVDRWVAMLAAYQTTLGSVVVIDCGTAVTIDLVSEQGVFIGGVIMPGLNTAYKSLQADTHAIDEVSSTTSAVSAVAQSTEKGVISGVLLGLAGGIERVVSEQHSLSDKIPAVFLTGGDAEKLMPHLKITVDYQDDLVLQGLRIIAEKES